MKTSQEFQRERSARRQAREAAEAKRAEADAKKVAAVQAALARTAQSGRGRVDRWETNVNEAKLKGVAPNYNPLRDLTLRRDFGLNVPIEHLTPEFFRVARIVEKKAPRLLEGDEIKAVAWLCKAPFVRPPETWVPRGKSRDTLFRSLADHLIAKFHMPAVLWNAFFSGEQTSTFVPLVSHVAAGGSLYAYVKEHTDLPFTRGMCHDLLATPSEWGFLDAIRRVQCRTAGTNSQFFNVWKTLQHSSSIQPKTEEIFWYSVLEWFGKAGMLEPGEIGPLCDYIAMRRRGEDNFTMKGRTVTATLRSMQDWHGNLVKEKNVKTSVYRTSGFQPGWFDDYKGKEKGVEVEEIWRIEEILTAKALHEEGRRMGHCVSSYGWQIEKGGTSIWSVVLEDGQGTTGAWAMVTLEVRNDSKRIVQARGRFNRSMTAKEHMVVNRWAIMNNLTLQLGYW